MILLVAVPASVRSDLQNSTDKFAFLKDNPSASFGQLEIIDKLSKTEQLHSVS